LRFHFRQKNSISVFVSIFSFRFYFSTEKSKSFRSTFIPICNVSALGSRIRVSAAAVCAAWVRWRYEPLQPRIKFWAAGSWIWMEI
jgi:hypothetical protein